MDQKNYCTDCSFFFIIAWPKLVPVLFDTPVILTWTEFTQGFLFLIEKKEVLMDKEFLGLVITPLDTHLMSAIVGLYFGGSLGEKVMRQSQLMSKAYGEEKPNEGPDIQIKDIPQLKKDLNYLRNKEGFENKIYDDSKSENKYLKKGEIENDGRIVYADGTLGGYATIGHGHKVTANDKYQIGKVFLNQN